MRTITQQLALRQALRNEANDKASIGLVPTMGNLHEGHMELVKIAKARSDCVVSTIFVNPLQFGANEDLEAYPRTLERDKEKLISAGCDFLFAPTITELYGHNPQQQTLVHVPVLSEIFCGLNRPGHFDGVATVVAKLFIQCAPDAAWFGEKDYQQLLVIRRLACDLGLAVAVHGVATVREPDGLALSSRNAYLDARERAIAPTLYRTLTALAEAVSGGAAPEAEAARGRAALLDSGFAAVDYVALRDAETLAPVADPTRPARALAAARLGRARLIDNVAVAPRGRG